MVPRCALNQALVRGSSEGLREGGEGEGAGALGPSGSGALGGLRHLFLPEPTLRLFFIKRMRDRRSPCDEREVQKE